MLKKLKNVYGKTGEALCNFCNKWKKYSILHISVVQVAILAFFTTFFIECLSKLSLFKAVTWMFTHPLIFLTNVLIVAMPYAVGIFFKRKYFFYSLAAFIWILIGVIDAIVIMNRVTPFTAGDLKTVFSVMSIFSRYVSVFEMVLIIIGLVAAIALVVNAFFKLPVNRGKFSYLKKAITGTLTILICWGLVTLSMKCGIMSVNFVNLRNAYQDYGLAYCFAQSVVNTGINKPSGYSDEKIDEILSQIATDGNADPTPNLPVEDDELPNVIFIQLESFFDVNRLEGVEFAENPIPTMTYLYQNYHTGLLGVPSISAGTANTEFEILTGMNMDDFGPGEIPYKTVLSKDLTTESIAQNLKEYGYNTHGMHNNTAGFYSRKVVYPNLGIDTCTFIEYMVNPEYNQIDWAKDKILTTYINKALNSSINQDFVFAVSVQAHGEYPDEDILMDESLLVSLDGIEGEVGEYNFAYYLEQIREMDEFIAELIKSLEARDEKTVLVLYGDHLPGFDFTDDDLSSGTLYDTEYVIWSNYDIGDRQVVDMQSYQLSAYVMELLGYNSGLISKLHQNREVFTQEEYLDVLKTLEYDMLYGDMNCWDGVNPYESKPVVYGYDRIEITGIEVLADPDKEDYYYIYVNGNNFTSYSKVFLNEETKVKTIYVDENTLFIPGVELVSGDSIIVSQSGTSITTLTATVPYICTSEELKPGK